MVRLRQADYTEQMWQLKPALSSLFFYLFPTAATHQRSRFKDPVPPSPPGDFKPSPSPDALYAAEPASSEVHRDPQEQTYVTGRVFHAQALVLHQVLKSGVIYSV